MDLEPLWDKKRISQHYEEIANVYINIILNINIDIAIDIDNDMNIYNDIEFFLPVIDIDIEFVLAKLPKQHFSELKKELKISEKN